jgi:AhpD family alkylhydroperoxidase
MMVDVKTKELIAIGASVSANCQPCVKFHLGKAKKLEIAPEDIKAAIQVGIMVRGGAAGQMDQLLSEIGKEIGIDLGINCDPKQACE